MINKLLIVGCGLIGSSILKKVCKKKIAKKIFVFEKSKKNQRTLKKFKLKFQLIKKIDKKISECDFVIICTPLSEYEKIFSIFNKYLKKNVLVTDVGSAKKTTITKIDKKTNRVSASIKALTEDPYENLGNKYQEGKIYEGEATKVMNYGLNEHVFLWLNG